MADVTVEQTRSVNGTSPKQRETLRSLRLGRIGKRATLADTPQLRGMLKVVGHLVAVDVGPEPGATERQDGAVSRAGQERAPGGRNA
jgi:large subunit ribosomal protein L30